MINAIVFYRIANWLYRYKVPILPGLIRFFIFIIYNSVVPPQSKIGKGTYLTYGGIGVIIHKRAVIGKNVVIGSNVTIGGRSGLADVPVIGDNVYIATGAKLIGNITIGDYAVIGANAVVLKDVPPRAVVAGVPAKILSFKGGEEFFKTL